MIKIYIKAASSSNQNLPKVVSDIFERFEDDANQIFHEVLQNNSMSANLVTVDSEIMVDRDISPQNYGGYYLGVWGKYNFLDYNQDNDNLYCIHVQCEVYENPDIACGILDKWYGLYFKLSTNDFSCYDKNKLRDYINKQFEKQCKKLKMGLPKEQDSEIPTNKEIEFARKAVEKQLVPYMSERKIYDYSLNRRSKVHLEDPDMPYYYYNLIVDGKSIGKFPVELIKIDDEYNSKFVPYVEQYDASDTIQEYLDNLLGPV